MNPVRPWFYMYVLKCGKIYCLNKNDISPKENYFKNRLREV